MPPRKRVRTLSSGLAARKLTGEDLTLTPEEIKLFETIKAVVKRFELATQVRVAGGWVRDKLLGRSSHDIDLALDDMTGLAFAEKVNEYLQENGLEVHRIGLIQANPDQSKHLETASVSILGQSIDLVNLRAEEYVQESRIPSMTFGTAQEDAERRDFTINALFYNINENIVEDLTQRGLRDLEEGVIRTPLPADMTFHDDPLRMLRAIRFASRFNFKLEDTIEKALQEPTNVTALQEKVSRERIGIELRSMLESARPTDALQLLWDYKLCSVVFMVPPYVVPNPNTEDPLDPELVESDDRMREHIRNLDWQARVDLAKQTVSILKAEQEADSIETTRFQYPFDERSPYKLDNYAITCLTTLFYDMNDFNGIGHPKRKLEPAMQLVVRDTVKMKASVAQDVALVTMTALSLIENLEAVKAAVAAANSDIKDNDDLRVAIGRVYVRAKHYMPIILAFTAAHRPDLEDVLSLTHKVACEDWLLRDMWKDKPLLDGKSLMKSLGIARGGTHIGILMDHQLDWRIRHRGNASANREECIKYLNSIKDPIVEAEEAKKAARQEAVAADKRKRQERHEQLQQEARERRERKLQLARETMAYEDKPQHRLGPAAEAMNENENKSS